MVEVWVIGLVFLIGFVLVIIAFAINAGLIPLTPQKKGVRETTKPTTHLLSTEHGHDTISKVDYSTHKLLLFRTNSPEVPIEECVIGDNTFMLDAIGGIVGENWLIHLGDKFKHDKLRQELAQGISADEHRAYARLRYEYAKLERDNISLRMGRNEDLHELGEMSRDILKSTAPYYNPPKKKDKDDD